MQSHQVRSRSTTVRGGSFDSATIEAVWNKGQVVSGYVSYRRDACGALILRSAYGQLGEYGWEIDHIVPVSKFKFRRFQGGSRAARRVKFPPANRSWRGAGGRDLRPKCHLGVVKK